MNTPKNPEWQNDPRLASMDSQKLKFLADFSDRMRSLPKDKMMPFLLSLRQEAEQKQIRFTDQETLLITAVLSADMSPDQKQRMEMLRRIFQKFA